MFFSRPLSKELVMNEEPQSRLIVPPTDEKLRKQLALKLKEYQKREAGEGKPWEYQHPELAHRLHGDYRDAYYKAYILDLVLKSDEPVDTWKLSQEMFAKWKDTFNINDFCNACAVIDKRCGNLPDVPVTGGTGLPELAEGKN